MGGTTSLAALGLNEDARVRAVRVEDNDAKWLAAAGLFVGQGVRVLRRGAFGGPLHVRVASGGDFAVDRHLAALIELEPKEGHTP